MSKTDELHDALMGWRKYVHDAEPPYQTQDPGAIARTICETLGISRELAQNLRENVRWIEEDPLVRATVPDGGGCQIHAANAFTALLDLAGTP